MSDDPTEQALSELLPYFEALETQTAAVLEVLKDKQIVTDEQLARYLEQAGNSSSVKWRAARVRMEHLFATSAKITTQPGKETSENKDFPTRNLSSGTPAASVPSEQAGAASADKSSEPLPEELPEASKNTPKHAEKDGATNDRKSGKENSESREAAEKDAA